MRNIYIDGIKVKELRKYGTYLAIFLMTDGSFKSIFAYEYDDTMNAKDYFFVNREI